MCGQAKVTATATRSPAGIVRCTAPPFTGAGPTGSVKTDAERSVPYSGLHANETATAAEASVLAGRGLFGHPIVVHQGDDPASVGSRHAHYHLHPGVGAILGKQLERARVR